MKSKILLLIGLLTGVLLSALFNQNGWSWPQAIAAGTAASMAVLWISECIPIYLTALLPLVIFPATGVMSMAELSPQYMNHIIFLFVGGFIMAYAVERSGLHKRIALKIILLCGSSVSKVLFGFMLASALLSMWILNTATVTMLLPAVLAVIHQLGKNSGKMASPLLLGIAYASSIGGMATIVGTLPNAIVMGHFNELYPSEEPITFLSWMTFALPLCAILFVTTFYVLKFRFLRKLEHFDIDLEDCRAEYKGLGKMSLQEKWVSGLFALMAIMWITIKKVEIGSFVFEGWSNASIFPEPGFIKESTVAMFFAILLFLIPTPKGKELVTWKDAQRLPVGIIFLFGAGYALVKSFQVTGVNELLKDSLIGLSSGTGAMIVVVVLCLVMTFMTELTSNTTSINLFVLVVIAVADNFPSTDPLYFILPVTFCASCAFMLPVATPPNTIVYGSELLPARDMMRSGLILNLLSVLIISSYCILFIS